MGTDPHDLEQRLRAVEDRLAILNLLSGYGPAVDSLDATAVAEMWTENGSYETDPKPLHGREAIREMVRSDPHRSFVARGCAHFLGVPKITIDGDRATARFHSLLVAHDPSSDRFEILRASANRCELVRAADVWLIERRVNRVLDGSEAARALFRVMGNGSKEAPR